MGEGVPSTLPSESWNLVAACDQEELDPCCHSDHQGDDYGVDKAHCVVAPQIQVQVLDPHAQGVDGAVVDVELEGVGLQVDSF